MTIQKVKIINRSGLHARPASTFVKEALKFKSDITIKYKEGAYNAKSMINVLSAGIRYEEEIEISCHGEDEKEAIKMLVELIESGLEE